MASDAVQQIKERLSIIDVVTPYVELHKAGKNYKGKSPFTNEKTPSFYVSPDRGMYYCFSSSQGGDIFTFVQSMEGVDFKGALKILAEKANVTLVPEDPKKRTERDQQYAVLEATSSFYQEWLAKRDDVLAYLRSRGLTKKTIDTWAIGYAPGPPNHGWRELREYLSKKGFTDKELFSAGLIKATEGGKAPYDVFRDRAMFPIRDASGRVVAFSGRIIDKASEAPKYVNSPETELFNKSEILFGYDKAKQGIRQYDFSLIVEGQFDVVLAHQAGYTNTVAVSGTALTPHHTALLHRLSDRVVLALDADRAGVSAVKRSADSMLVRGMDVKVARLPQGKDPADLINEDVTSFKQAIAGATHVIEFLIAIIKESARDERTFKLQVRDEVVPYLLKIESRIDREHFVGIVATALQSTTEAVTLEIARLERSKERASPEMNRSEEQAISRDASHTESRIDSLKAYVVVMDELLLPKEQLVLRELFANITNSTVEATRNTLDASLLSPLLFQLENEVSQMQRKMVYTHVLDNVYALKLLLLKQQVREKRELLKEAEDTGDDTMVEKIIEEIATLQKRLAESAYSVDIFEASNAP